MHGYYVQAIEQIEPERALIDGGLQVDMGRGDDPKIHRYRFIAADGVDLFFLQHTQQLGLQGQWHIADLIQKQRAAIGLGNFALLVLRGAGEGAFGVAKEFGFQQVRRYRGAVNTDEWLFAAVALLVDHACEFFFTGTGFAQQHHWCVAMGNLNGRAHCVH